MIDASDLADLRFLVADLLFDFPPVAFEALQVLSWGIRPVVKQRNEVKLALLAEAGDARLFDLA